MATASMAWEVPKSVPIDEKVSFEVVKDQVSSRAPQGEDWVQSIKIPIAVRQRAADRKRISKDHMGTDSGPDGIGNRCMNRCGVKNDGFKPETDRGIAR